MAVLMTPRKKTELGRMTAPSLRLAYNELAEEYSKLTTVHYAFCHKCNDFKGLLSFYPDKSYNSGYFPICKQCLLEMATDYDKKSGMYIDNKSKTIDVLHMLNMPYIDSVYNSCLVEVKNQMGERTKNTAYQLIMQRMKSLPHYSRLTWKDSQFGDTEDVVDIVEEKRIAKRATKKRFGNGFTENDYLFLEDQYEDWCARTQVDSKSQETYVMQICLQLLDIDKDRKNGKDVSGKLKALDQLMNSANLQPKQNVDNSVSDNLSFGQLIEKWEQEKPIPEPDEEFKDVNGIGKFLRVFFAGHLAKSIGLKNSYSQEYDEEMAKYSVTKSETSEEVVSSDIYNMMFGNKE